MSASVVDISITNRTQSTSGKKPYVIYTINARKGNDRRNIPKRFSQFHELLNSIKAAYPKATATLPKFPPKTLFNKASDESFLAQRSAGLQAWLRAVVVEPTLQGSEEVSTFLGFASAHSPDPSSDAVDTLASMFPDLERGIILDVLRGKGNDVNAAAADLLVLTSDAEPSQVEHQPMMSSHVHTPGPAAPPSRPPPEFSGGGGYGTAVPAPPQHASSLYPSLGGSPGQLPTTSSSGGEDSELAAAMAASMASAEEDKQRRKAKEDEHRRQQRKAVAKAKEREERKKKKREEDGARKKAAQEAAEAVARAEAEYEAAQAAQQADTIVAAQAAAQHSPVVAPVAGTHQPQIAQGSAPTAPGEDYRTGPPPSELTEEQKRQLYHNGFTVLRGVIPEDYLETARYHINAKMAYGWSKSDTESAVKGGALPDLQRAEPITDLYFQTALRTIVESALGGGRVHPVRHGQIAVRFPHDPQDFAPHPVAKVRDFLSRPGVPWKGVWRVDGLPSTPEAALTPEKVGDSASPPPASGPLIDLLGGMEAATVSALTPAAPTPAPTAKISKDYTMLAGVLLTDMEGELEGNLSVFPGTHHILEDYLQSGENATELLNKGTSKLPNSALFPLWPASPVQITGRAGDVFLMHYLAAHNGAPNLSSSVAQMVWFPLHHATRRVASRPSTVGASPSDPLGLAGLGSVEEDTRVVPQFLPRPEALRDMWMEWEGLRAIVAENRALADAYTNQQAAQEEAAKSAEAAKAAQAQAQAHAQAQAQAHAQAQAQAAAAHQQRMYAAAAAAAAVPQPGYGYPPPQAPAAYGYGGPGYPAGYPAGVAPGPPGVAPAGYATAAAPPAAGVPPGYAPYTGVPPQQ